jgi:glycosyltransferase involved in cell wall biosynthesis
MKKVKLFVDGHWFDDLYQSPCVFLKGLYSELIQDDRFNVYMAAADIDHLKKVFNYTDRINYLTYKSRSKYYRLAIDAPGLIRQNKIVASHFQYITPLIKNSLEIVTIHDLLFKEFKDLFPWRYRIAKDILFRRSAKKADLITTVSQYSFDSIINHYGLPPEKVKVVPNGISTEFFSYKPTASPSKLQTIHHLDRYILFVSRVEPRKNHIALLKAYVNNALWQKGYKLVFVGRTDIEVQELRTYIAGLPVEALQNIVWLKNVAFPDLLDLYKKASLFAYPSLAEGFGIPPLEAAALKTKTLCSNATAMADYTFFEADLFDPNNNEEFSKKMIQKLEQDDLKRRELIALAIHERYNWKKIASDFASFVYALVN